MIWLGAALVVQIFCVIHAMRTGREQIWMWVIMLFSLPGCFAYFVFEIMPEMIGPDSPRGRAKALAKMRSAQPVDGLKKAEAALAQVDTAANRIALGDAYSALGSHRDAAEQYRIAVEMLAAPDAQTQMRLASALLEGGDYAGALAEVDAIEVPRSTGEADRLSLLRARILAELDQTEEALATYADIVPRIAGDEAHCRYAALLLETGDRDTAREVLEQVESRFAKLPPALRVERSAMYDWAMGELRKLRG